MVQIVQKWFQKMQTAWEQSGLPQERTTGLLIPNRSLNVIIAGLFMFGLSCFMLGYFWGHRCALERFVSKIEEESFADRISYALYTMNDRDQSEFEADEQEDTNGTSEEGDEEVLLVQAEDKTTDEFMPLISEKTVAKPVIELKIEPVIISDTSFVAPLAGFGTLQAATAFAQKVKSLDPKTTVQEKLSKTARGKKITWYQVVTGEYEKKDELEQLIKKISAREHLKDVRIIEKRKGN